MKWRTYINLILTSIALAACTSRAPSPQSPAVPFAPSEAEAIRQTVRAHAEEIRACAEKHDGPVSGKLVLQWDVTENGRVADVRVVRPLVPEIDDCIAGAVESWVFPFRPQGGKVRRVMFPFNISSLPTD